jgi:hypothetical protein
VALGPPGVVNFWTMLILNPFEYGIRKVSFAPISVRPTVRGLIAGRQRIPFRFATLTSRGYAPAA